MTHVEDRPKSGKGLALVGDCCRLPFGYIRDGRLVLRMPHERRGHELALSANDLRSLARLLDEGLSVYALRK
jgi:hypothetical protein